MVLFGTWPVLLNSQASTQVTAVAHVRGGGNVAAVCFTNTFPLVIH